MEPLLGGDREAAFLRNRDKIAKMTKLHSMPPEYETEPTKSFSITPACPK
jgi:hypothetical protein